MSSKQIAQQLIDKERERQKTEEGYTLAHDVENHSVLEIARAAKAYYQAAMSPSQYALIHWWPWDEKYFKPTDKRACLIKAGALMRAAFDLQQRMVI